MRRFSNTEWSGPAWYRITKETENGFPLEVKLEHFIPIDLGDGSSTELDGEELRKLLPEVYKKHPKLGKCFLGLIHSHHTMGAFFSGTDEEAIHQESSKDGLFFSTVVASAKEKYVSAVGYKDQFGFSQMIEGEVKTQYKETSQPEWRVEADLIAKKKEEAKSAFAKSGYNYKWNRYDQTHMFGENVMSSVVTESNEIKPVRTILGAHSSSDIKDQKEINELIAEDYEKLESNVITEDEFVKRVRDIDPKVEPHWYIDRLGLV